MDKYRGGFWISERDRYTSSMSHLISNVIFIFNVKYILLFLIEMSLDDVTVGSLTGMSLPNQDSQAHEILTDRTIIIINDHANYSRLTYHVTQMWIYFVINIYLYIGILKDIYSM